MFRFAQHDIVYCRGLASGGIRKGCLFRMASPELNPRDHHKKRKIASPRKECRVRNDSWVCHCERSVAVSGYQIASPKKQARNDERLEGCGRFSDRTCTFSTSLFSTHLLQDMLVLCVACILVDSIDPLDEHGMGCHCLSQDISNIIVLPV